MQSKRSGKRKDGEGEKEEDVVRSPHGRVRRCTDCRVLAEDRKGTNCEHVARHQQRSDSAPNYRSRWLAKQFKTSVEFELFAATPPLDAIRYVISMAASSPGAKLMANDVSRAYFYAPAGRPVYVTLPDEDCKAEDKGMVGRLQMSMYGTRDAAANWAAEYGATLIAAGYRQGKASPCFFSTTTTTTQQSWCTAMILLVLACLRNLLE